jgi:hypothetical protein
LPIRSERSLAARRILPTTGGPSILLQLLAKRLDLLVGLGLALLQRLATPERRRPRAGTHPHPILGHPMQRHQPLVHQRRHAVPQQTVQQLPVGCAEVRQPVVVHRHPATNPSVGDVVLAQPGQLPSGSDTIHGRVEPQGHENPRINRVPPSPALHGPNLFVQLAQVQPLDILPDQTCPMVFRQQAVQTGHLHHHLMTLGTPQPRPTPQRRFLRLTRWNRKQRCLFIPIP